MTSLEMFPSLRSGFRRYTLALCGILACAVAYSVSNTAFHAPYILPLTFAVIGATMLGVGPAVAAVLLAILVSDFLFIPPIGRLSLNRVTLLISVYYSSMVVLVSGGGRFLRRHGRDQKLKLFARSIFGWPGLVQLAGPANKPQYLGRLDGGVLGEVYGWALDGMQSSVPPKITFVANGRPVGEALAIHYRPDVGQHCFYFDLTRCGLPASAASVEASFPDGKPLPNSPLILEIPPPTEPRHKDTVLFMHIAKAAGTSFREAISDNYKQSEIAYLYPDPPGFLPSHLGLLPLEQRAKFRVAIGHFQYGIHSYLPQPCTYVTIVRNPISRVISHYQYSVEIQAEHVQSEDPGAGLVRLLESHVTLNFDNLMVRCFSGVSEEEAPVGQVNREIYDRALHHLRTAFLFVGHQERADNAYAVLQQLFNWKPRSSLPVVNRNAPLKQKSYDSMRKTIEHFNRWDCLLYAEVCKLFP